MSPEALATHSRRVEDIAMYVGIAQAALYGFGEFLIQMGLVTPPEDQGIPYMTIALFLGCILPKTVGRATAGKVWTTLAGGVAARLGKKADPP